MSERVTMPALGESVTEGTVTRWLKSVGDRIEVDEPLLEVSTDKVDTEVPSPVAGTVQQILVGEDETVPVGADLAVIGDGEAPSGEDSGSGQAGDQGQAASDQPPAPPQEQSAPAEQQPAAEEPVAESEHAPAHAEQSAPAEHAPAEPSSQPAEEEQAAPASGGTTVTMPALGESVTEGTVTRWLKAEGDHVDVDEPLLEVSTDKVDTEVPSPVAGTVQRILVGEDETVPVGADLAVVGDGAATSGGEPESAPAPAAEPSAPEQRAEVSSEPAPEPAPEPAAQPSSEQAEPQQAPSAPDESAPADNRPAEAAEAPAASSRSDFPAPEATAVAAAGPAAADAATYITPLVRKLASEHNVDLAALTGTGVGGRIRKQDVLDAAKAAQDKAAEQAAQAAQSAPTPAPAESAPAAAPAAAARPATASSAKRGTTEKMSRLRRVIAQRMVESLQTSAQLTTVVEVDVTKIARLRDRAKRDFEAREGVKLSFLPFFALAVVEALKVHASVNASIEGDEVTYHGSENLGIAVDTERGLLVPVIKEAGDLNIAGLARKIADLAERTRTNKIGPDELGGGTFTLTNTGSRGALFDTPIVNQPQVGILGTGAVVRKPVVVADPEGGETIAIRSMVYLALSYDHRLVDGADAARFLSTIKERLEDGAFDADLGL